MVDRNEALSHNCRCSQGLTDGRRIIREVTRMNKGRKWAIHTLGLGRYSSVFLLWSV